MTPSTSGTVFLSFYFPLYPDSPLGLQIGRWVHHVYCIFWIVMDGIGIFEGYRHGVLNRYQVVSTSLCKGFSNSVQNCRKRRAIGTIPRFLPKHGYPFLKSINLQPQVVQQESHLWARKSYRLGIVAPYSLLQVSDLAYRPAFSHPRFGWVSRPFQSWRRGSPPVVARSSHRRPFNFTWGKLFRSQVAFELNASCPLFKEYLCGAVCRLTSEIPLTLSSDWFA